MPAEHPPKAVDSPETKPPSALGEYVRLAVALPIVFSALLLSRRRNVDGVWVKDPTPRPTGWVSLHELTADALEREIDSEAERIVKGDPTEDIMTEPPIAPKGV